MIESHHTQEPDFGAGKKTFNTYILGVVLCVILTLIPFAVVMKGSLSHAMTYAVLITSAVAQFLVQVVCFLRLNLITTQSRINIMSFIFAIVVLIVIIGGSVWIMWNLNYNMMH